MADWEFSESRPTGGGDYNCGCACCYADENHPQHEADCPIGQAVADLARVTAERDEARDAAKRLAALHDGELLERVCSDRDNARAENARLRAALEKALAYPNDHAYKMREVLQAALAGEAPDAT